MNKKPVIFMLGNSGSTVLDPSFPRVAAKAALEVDGALLRVQGKKAPLEVQVVGVNALLPIIKRIVEAALASKSPANITAKLDPASANVFITAYGRIDPNAVKGQALEQQKFAKAAERVVGVLEKINNKDEVVPVNTKDLEFARDFCLALSDTAAIRQYVPHAAMQGLRRIR